MYIAEKCPCGQVPCHQPVMPVLFHREAHFYPIETFPCDNIAHHAGLNPGTVKVTCAITGKTLWDAGNAS